MLVLSLWLKNHNFNQIRFDSTLPPWRSLLPCTTGEKPAAETCHKGDKLKDTEQRRLQKAYLRYHDEKNCRCCGIA